MPCHADKSSSFIGITCFWVGDNVIRCGVGALVEVATGFAVGCVVLTMGAFVGINVETGDKVVGAFVDGALVVGAEVGASEGPSTIIVPVGDLVGLEDDFFVGDALGDVIVGDSDEALFVGDNVGEVVNVGDNVIFAFVGTKDIVGLRVGDTDGF